MPLCKTTMAHRVASRNFLAQRRRQKSRTTSNSKSHDTGGGMSCFKNCFRTNMGWAVTSYQLPVLSIGLCLLYPNLKLNTGNWKPLFRVGLFFRRGVGEGG